MASKRRNTFYQNKRRETTEIVITVASKRRNVFYQNKEQETREIGLLRGVSEEQARNGSAVEGGSSPAISCISGYETDCSYPTDGQHLFTQTVYCCTCGLGTRLPNGDVRHLPLNHSIQAKMLLSKRVQLSCQLCSLDNSACNKCEECDICLCAVCSETHRDFWDSAVHSLVPIKDPTKKVLNQVQPVCDLHGGEEYIEFCGDCGVLVCQECRGSVGGLHWGHRAEPLQPAARRQAALLRRALESAQPRLKETLRTSEMTRHQEERIKVRCVVIDRIPGI
ncbi:hypothetical protein AAG570_001615 [Ranatra chinensis]|uniref:B box-type domain-containing protein n=1 Tax=Ranatra chinensis TaxID=642074 RepID=A0ABD0YAZ8_9HEMI